MLSQTLFFQFSVHLNIHEHVTYCTEKQTYRRSLTSNVDLKDRDYVTRMLNKLYIQSFSPLFCSFYLFYVSDCCYQLPMSTTSVEERGDDGGDGDDDDDKRQFCKTRCSAIAERPRCRVRYSFRQK